jgi:hypothetical protein
MGVVLPRSQSRWILEVVDVAGFVLPDAHQLMLVSMASAKPTVAQDSLEASMERVEVQVDGMSHNNGWRIPGHHQSCPFLSEFAPSATRYFILSE